MATRVVDRFKVIDADTHVSEPEDLWTSRVSTKRWGDLVPHVRWVEEEQQDVWFFGGERFAAAAGPAMAGWKEHFPSHPPRLADADPGCWNPYARIERMDQYGMYAHVIYPNVGGFGSGRFLELKDPELMLACVRAYNDFLSEWCATAPNRLIPITALPFWDVEASVEEIDRCWRAGHRGVLMGSEPEFFGQPYLADPHWYPIYHAAEDRGLSINFHVASGDMTKLQKGFPGNGPQTNFAKVGVTMYMDNVRAVLEVIVSGLCHRFPELNFVSVESGIGWVPFAISCMDWQWINLGAYKEHPDMKMLPSEYFKRQVYACFWFERETAKKTIELIGADNILYETDYPHPTSMSPGPASEAERPSDFLEHFADLPDETLRKVLHDNAAKVYQIQG